MVHLPNSVALQTHSFICYSASTPVSIANLALVVCELNVGMQMCGVLAVQQAQDGRQREGCIAKTPHICIGYEPNWISSAFPVSLVAVKGDLPPSFSTIMPVCFKSLASSSMHPTILAEE